jgi:hypothetical protein
MDAVATGDHNARPVLEASVWHIRSSQYLSVLTVTWASTSPRAGDAGLPLQCDGGRLHRSSSSFARAAGCLRGADCSPLEVERPESGTLGPREQLRAMADTKGRERGEWRRGSGERYCRGLSQF